jgi:rubrerythrin
MDEAKFDEIINFAVDREKEAVTFYRELQAMAQFEHQKEVFKEFESMERGHIAILEGIRSRGTGGIVVANVPDLKIADYLVEPKASAEMTYQDILITAMKKEERANALYSDLAADAGDGETKTIFEKLASEEAKHKLHFETLYDDEILKED